jgi:tetratricopeptide (TPR) repeat protein
VPFWDAAQGAKHALQMTKPPELTDPVPGDVGPAGLRPVLVCLVLGLLTVAAYWPVARNGFINFDDPDYVSSNQMVQAGLTWDSVRWAFASYHSSNWHPVTWLSHMVDCQLYGLKPAGHHFTNLLFHVANTFLLFGLLKRFTGALWRSALVASLFALHPLHVESVAWVSERKDVLSGFFFLLTLWAYARYGQLAAHSPRSTVARAWVWYTLSILLFAVGLMAKPMLVTLPFLLLLLDYWPLQRLVLAPNSGLPSVQASRFKVQGSTFRYLLIEKLLFLALSVASCIVTFLVQRASGAVVSLSNEPFAVRLANAIVAYGWYLIKTFWPVNLSVFYPHPPLDLTSLLVVGSLALLVPITAAAVLAAFRPATVPWLASSRFMAPAFLSGWLWFLGMLVPVVGFVQVGKQAWADRYTYLPHIGLFVALVWGFSKAKLQNPNPKVPDAATEHAPPNKQQATRTTENAARSTLHAQPQTGSTSGLTFDVSRLTFRASGIVFALLVLVLAFLTYCQTTFWRNDTTLFQHAAAVTENNFVAYGVLANTLLPEKKWTEAIALCQKAIALSPGYTEAHNTLGIIYNQQGRYDDAIASFRQALQTDATYPDAYVGLADIFNRQKKYADAEAQCREALRFEPLHLTATFNLAIALHNEGKLDEAASYYRRVLEAQPKFFAAHRYLGNVLVAQGKAGEAIPHFLAALETQPKDVDTHVVLGVALLDRGKLDEANTQFLEALRLQPTNSIANYQLALSRQSQGQAREAIDHYHAALRAQPDWPEALNNLAWLLAANPDAAIRNGPEAVSLAERACKLTEEKEPLFLGTKAAAYAEAGRFAEAIAAAEKARDLATAAGLKEVAEKNRELLELYRSGKAYHEVEALKR